LLLPSYWPTRRAPVVGAQVYEQTELLSDEFDYRIIFCLPGMGWKRYFLYTLVRIFTGKRLFTSCEDELLSGSLRSTGAYFFQSKSLSYKKNRRIEEKAYEFLLRKMIKEGWKPDLIHARTAEYAGVYAVKLSKVFTIPLVLTENTLMILNENNEFVPDRIRSYQYALENADEVLVVSNYLKAEIMANNFDVHPTVIGNWVNEKKFSLNGSANKVFTIFSIGTIGFIKDWVTFFRAIHCLVHEKKLTDIRVVIAVTQVYDKESRDFIPALCQQFAVKEFCEIRYEIPRDQISSLFHDCHVFISTSIRETFGIATCEAAFCGKPVIATMNGGILDIINAENGVLVNISDYQAIADAIVKIKNKELVFDPIAIRNSVLGKFGTAAFKERLASAYIKTMK